MRNSKGNGRDLNEWSIRSWITKIETTAQPKIRRKKKLRKSNNGIVNSNSGGGDESNNNNISSSSVPTTMQVKWTRKRRSNSGNNNSSSIKLVNRFSKHTHTTTTTFQCVSDLITYENYVYVFMYSAIHVMYSHICRVCLWITLH